MNDLKPGERVLVKPTHPTERVQRAAGMYGQFLKPDWQEGVLDSFLLARCLDGSVMVKPIPEPQPDSVAMSSLDLVSPTETEKEKEKEKEEEV